MVNESDILDAASTGQPFYMEYRFVGDNPQNKSGKSSKFWLIESFGDPGSLVIRTRFGPIGKWGKMGKYYADLRDALKDAIKKEKKGYRIHHREAGEAARKWINKAVDAPVVLPPFSQWAGALPPPFNTITFLDSDGFATNRDGALVCRLSVDEATAIRQTHDMTR